MGSPAKLTEAQVMTEAQASEYDFIILVDKSGSMGTASTKMAAKDRWAEAKEFTETFARFAEKVDEDGITVIPFAGSHTVYDNVKADKISDLFTSERPGGSTNLAPALEAAFAKKFASKKKAIIMVLTDGEANDGEAVKNSITNAASKLSDDSEIGIQFVQVGEDPAAVKFLEDLDDNLKGAKYDIVNSLSREQAEGYTMEQLLWLAVND